MDFKKVVFQRSFEVRTPQNFTPSTFAEWMDKFELEIEILFQSSQALNSEWNAEIIELQQLDKYLAGIENKFPLGYPLIFKAINQCRKVVLENYENASEVLPAVHNTKIGRKKAPFIIYELVISGLELSKNEYSSYEPFRIYYSEGIKNNFNLNDRLKAGKTLGPPPSRSKDIFDIERFLDFIFPSVPAIKPEDTMWARNLKSTCKKALDQK